MRRVLIAAEPTPVLAESSEAADLVTELVIGERLEVLDKRGGWLRVVVPDHPSHLDPRGYPGWVHDDSVLEVEDWTPDLKVVAANPNSLPLGALLQSSGKKARTPDGGSVKLEKATLPTGEPVGLSAVEISCSLLGLPYRWGGTDSTTGMDCSGLVFRAMQLLGVRAPRDANDQYEAASFKSRESWNKVGEGDLVFFGTEAITHVGFYLGDGLYVSEHGDAGMTIRGMGEDPYWGFARYDVAVVSRCS